MASIRMLCAPRMKRNPDSHVLTAQRSVSMGADDDHTRKLVATQLGSETHERRLFTRQLEWDARPMDLRNERWLRICTKKGGISA